jgi:hypothetical protein
MSCPEIGLHKSKLKWKENRFKKRVGIIPLRSNIYFPVVSQLNGFEKGSWTRRLLLLPPRLLGQRTNVKSTAGGGAIALHKRERSNMRHF